MDILLSAGFAVAATMLVGARLARHGRFRGWAAAAVWLIVVCAPLAAAVLGQGPREVAALDHAGALAFLMPAGAVLLVWARIRPDAAVHGDARRGLLAGIISAAVAVAIVLADQVLSAATVGLIAATAMMAGAGAAGGMCVRILAGRPRIGGEWMTGGLSGLAAAGAAAPWLTWQWQFVAGIAAGAVAALVARRVLRRAPRAGEDARIAAALLIGPCAGALALGLFAGVIGMVHTGSVGLLVEQARSVLLLSAWSFAWAVALTLVFKARIARPDPDGEEKTPGVTGGSAVGDTGLEPMTSSV